jgi:nitrite reductase/ring-hydroxylating ferredoxin subunit
VIYGILSGSEPSRPRGQGQRLALVSRTHLYYTNAADGDAVAARRASKRKDDTSTETKFRRRGSMAEQYVGKIAEFKDGDRRIIFAGDNEIGIFRHEGQFYAYSNFCLHQGGPACEGLTIAKVEERLLPDKTSQGLYFSDSEMHFVCPWHGYEYDMKTGECVSDRKLKLRKYKVVEKGDEVYVLT